MKIAALMTCHNWREKTLACLAALHANAPVPGVALAVVLVDDGSTDGTAAAVLGQYPDTRVIRGDGSLFWNGGMHKAFEVALRGKFDAFNLWLNDDTMLYPDALTRLVAAARALRADTGRDAVGAKPWSSALSPPGFLKCTPGPGL